MWEIIPTTEGQYKIRNRWSGLYLGISGASTSDGAICIQMEDDGSDNLLWYFLVTE